MPTLLAADDSNMMHRVYRKTFRDSEFDLLAVARNGREAVDLYRQHRPDAILLDITMPEMDGMEALRAIREADPEACCLMCTALEEGERMVDCIRSGASGYVHKPFEKEALLQKLRDVLAGKPS